MPWTDNSGGRGPTRGPWGQPPKGPGNDSGNGGGGRNEPPDLEELLQASRQRLKRAFPKGRGKGRGGGSGGAQISPKMFLFGGAGLVGLWLLSGFYQVQASELGVVTTFGKYDRLSTPGLHWRFPSPFQDVRIETVTALRSNPIPESSGARGAGTSEGLMLTRDKNIVDVGLTVQWQIKPDVSPGEGGFPAVAQFSFLIDNPARLVTTIGESAIREVVGKNDLNYIQTEGRTVVQEQTLALMQQSLDQQNTGILVVSVNLEKTEPPTPEVNAAFLDVNAADQDRDQYINTARAYANRVVPEARGQAQRILEDARAYQARVTAEARGQADRFNAVYEEYRKAPEVTRERMYLETIERVLGPMNKIIMENDSKTGVVPYMSLDELRRRQQPQPAPQQPQTGASQ